MTDIEMPQLGESVTEGTITKWFKAVGDEVAEDETLFEVSTDKVDSEVPSPSAGFVAEILVPEGETVDVGTPLVRLSDSPVSGDAPSEPAPEAAPAPAPEASSAAPEPQAASEPAPAAPAQASASPQASSPTGAESVVLSPLVRRLVEENNIDPSTINGTGVGGRITRDDVLAVIEAPGKQAQAPAAPAVEQPSTSTNEPAPSPQRGAAPAAVHGRGGEGDRVPLNKIRQLTGEHMVQSMATSPHAVTAIEVDFEAVERARKPMREAFKAEEGFSLTYLPFIGRAVVDALEEFPHLNATVGDGELIVHQDVNLAIAVDLDYQGLLAPVVEAADSKRLRAIARDISDLADRARTKKLSPDDLSGATFTLSNSGSYGTLFVIPIINQPQVAIMSTDGVARRPVVVTLPDGSESIAIHSVGNLTLAWDHRAFDGAYAAAFLARVKDILETRDWAAEL